MRLLLDECVPQRLKHDFPEHNVWTVDEVGLCGVKNGELLTAAAKKFDALITVDRQIQFQQNLSSFDIALIILIAKTLSLSSTEATCAKSAYSSGSDSARRYCGDTRVKLDVLLLSSSTFRNPDPRLSVFLSADRNCSLTSQ